jgi:hypothetical protein
VFKSAKHTDVMRAGGRSKARVAVLLGCGALVLGALLVAVAPPRPWDATGQLPAPDAAPLAAGARQQITTSLARLPLSFAPAAAAEDADFTARGAGYRIALSPTALTLELKGADAPVAMRFVNTNAGSPGIGEAKLPGRLNYFIGNDPSRWRTDVPTFAAVRYHDLYAGIDLLHHGTAAGELEHDLVVSPGADPGQIAFRIEGTLTQDLDPSGDLLLGITAGELRLRRPVIYQEDGSGRTLVAGGYRLLDDARVGFWLGRYDPALALVIDPVLLYSTYLGGGATDAVRAIAVDVSGNAYVTGETSSTNFPTASPYQGANGGGDDAFVTKLNPAGSALIYSTYLGGSGGDFGRAIAVDASGNAYVAGQTSSTNFPTVGPYQGAHGGGSVDAFVTKLNPAGSALVYSTYLGGSGGDFGYAIAVGASGNAYVTGTTFSTDFPTVGAYQGADGGGYDAFVTKLNPAGSALIYSTYLGGAGDDSGNAIAVDASGNAYVAGQTLSTNFPTVGPYQGAHGGGSVDAFVTKLNPAGSALIYSTYLGGSGDDYGRALAVDASGNAYVTGQTSSTNFPTASPYQGANGGGSSYDAFVTKLNPAGSALVYSTYLGGSGYDAAYAIAVSASGNAYVAGHTYSTNFPTVNPYSGINSGGSDVFVTKLNPAGSALIYSTYIGGPGTDNAQGIAVDASGQAYVGGIASTAFPTVAPYQGAINGTQDGFVLMLAAAPAPTVTAISPTNGPLAGGTAVTITGTGFVTGATITIGGTAATGVVFVSATSLTATAPAHAPGVVNIVVTNPDTETGTGASLYTYAGAPTVTAISPTNGPLAGGTAVTITGTGFVTGATVTIGGSSATGVGFVSATSLTATAPAHAAGTVNVVVTNPDTQTGTGASLYTYAAAPTVSAISPTSGPTAGGTAVTITGASFVSGATVTIGGTAATGVGFVSATSLLATTPAHAAGLGDVVVTNPDAQIGTGPNLFTFLAAPTVSAMSPTGGPLGGGTGVTITGTAFVSGATVTIGGTAATGVAFVSATSLTATAPPHVAGAVNVVVTNPDTQTGTGTGLFTYATAPTVSGISPTNGPIAGGTAVTITGTGFVNGAAVTIGGISATGVAFVNATSITATTPAHAAGTVHVAVTNPDSQVGTGTNLFSYVPAPTVSAISPTSGPAGGGTAVTITGTGFIAGATVTIGGSSATGVGFVSATSLLATTPAHAAGLVNVVVSNPDAQSGTGTSLFTFVGAPTVSAISPTGGALAGGTAVTITGTGFVSGATVTLGGTSATGVAFVSATSLSATTPAHAPGVVNVVVTNPDAQIATGASLFTYSAAPTVSATAPTGGPLAGGTAVTISGTGFLAGATVTIGGTAATGVVFVSSTSLSATTPAHAAGPVNVVVTNADSQTGTGVSLFTYASAPTVSAISPAGGALAGGTALVITGTGFSATPSVTLGGTPATGVSFVSATTLTATAPAHGAGLVNVVVTNPDTQAGTGTSLFTYAAAPTVSAISPTSGPAGGGSSVTITGTGFVNGASVVIGGSAATTVAFVSSISLTATTPAHAAGPVNVVVTNPDTQTGTGTNLFTYVAAPSVTGISPTAGLTGGGTAATITGTAFVTGATVTIGGTSATGVVFVSVTTLNVTTPAHAAGTATVTVTNPDTQSGSCTNCYTYGTPPPAPTVSGITATSGPSAGGSTVILSGSGFIVGATVSLGGTAATGITVVSASTITATSPAHAAGSVDVVVINPDTQTASCVSCFTYIGPPAPAPVPAPGPSDPRSCAAVSNGTITETCIVHGSHARIELRAGTRVFRADGAPFEGTLLAPEGSALPLGAGIAAAITVRAQDGTPFTLAQPALLTIDPPVGLLPRDVQPIALNGAARPTYFSKANSPIATSSGEVVGVGMLIGGSGQYGLAIIPEVAGIPVAALSPIGRSGLHARIVGESAWPTLEPNQIATLIVQVQNTGDVPWFRDIQTSELRLGATAPLDNTRDTDSGLLEYPLGGIKNRYARQTEELVAPGGIATMKLQVRAPASEETRRIDMRPVVDGVLWLEDEGLYIIVDSKVSVPGVVTP